jgi:hypothetical protein
MKKLIEEFLIICGLCVVVLIFWQRLELSTMGEITYRKVDDIIASILTFSLYINLKNWKRG